MTELIYAKPDVPATDIEPVDAPVLSLTEAVQVARAGTVIKLLPGRFIRKIAMRRKRGADGKPIIIQGSGNDTIIDGLVDPLSDAQNKNKAWWSQPHVGRDLRKSRDNNAPAFRLKNCSWIEFRDLSVKRCWPHFLHIRSCDHITVAGSQVIGGKDAIFVDDTGSKKPSHHLLIEHNAWCQDPTGLADPTSDEPTGRRLWNEWVWHQFKKKPNKGPWAGDPEWEDVRFMNGGFVVTEHMAGSLIVRHNQMRFAFNAVMLMTHEDQSKRQALKPEDLGDAPKVIADPEQFLFNYEPPDPSRNTNIEIYGNTIEYIRDNAVEPEYGATNLWVWNNRIRNVHKAWSIHNNGGGFWYFFGNVGTHDEVPPAQVNEPPAWRKNKPEPRKLGGSIFKLLYGPPLPELSCFAFHNSWRPRGSVLNDGELRNFTHLNNAVEHCAPTEPTNLYCREKRFARSLEDGKPFLYGFATKVPPTTPGAVNTYDSDVSTGDDFPDEARAQNQEANGISSDLIFDPGKRAKYILHDDSPARGAARPIKLQGHKDWPAAEDWVSEAPDVGAVQPNGHFQGPIFAHHPNPHYDEQPRLVGLEADGAQLSLVYSVPLVSEVPSGTGAIDLDTGAQLVAKHMAVSGRRLVLDLGTAVSVNAIAAIHLPHGFRAEADGKELPMTTWGSIVPLEISPG